MWQYKTRALDRKPRELNQVRIGFLNDYLEERTISTVDLGQGQISEWKRRSYAMGSWLMATDWSDAGYVGAS